MDRQRMLEIPRVKFDAQVVNGFTTNGNLLDIGCYDQILKTYLKKEITYVGIDYPEYDLEKDRLHIPNAFFNYVCCFEVLEHLVDPLNCIKEIKRVVKDDGTIFISLPNQSTLAFRLRILIGKPYGQPFETDKNKKHYHDMTYNQAKEFMVRHFNILKIYHFGDAQNGVDMSWFANHFPSLFSYHNVFVCKKLGGEFHRF